jgi:L-lactate dehydrogenase complex protein LldF
VKIDLHHHLLQNRRNAARQKPRRFERLGWKIFGAIVNHPRFYAMARIFARIAQPFHALIAGSRLDPARGWTQSRDLPPIARQSFKNWWRNRA